MTEEEFQDAYGRKFNDNRVVAVVKLVYAKPQYIFAVLDGIKSTVGKVTIDESTGVIVMVDTPEKIEQMKQAVAGVEDGRIKTRLYSLQYAQPDDVAAKLRSKLDDHKVGSIVGDSRSRQVVVTGFLDRMAEVEDLIKGLDKKTKEVLVEIRILKVVLNPQLDYGIDWSQAFSNAKDPALRKLSFRGAFPISSTVSTAAALGTVGKIAYGTVGSGAFAAELKALHQVIDTKILANPRLTILDGEEASIHIGDTLAYVTTSTTQGSSTSTTAETVNFVDVGIKLKVTPVINDDGFVSMKIKPEISSKTGDYTTPNNNTIPLINTTTAETSVMVKDGTTIIIGGLRKDERTKTHKGLPVLKDIPVIGLAFGMREDEITKTEIVIMLTPHIITGSKDVTDRKWTIKEEESVGIEGGGRG